MHENDTELGGPNELYDQEIIDKIECIPCKSAAEFLATLRLSNERWLEANEFSSSWIFRGQSDASFGLLPSAWRGKWAPKMISVKIQLQHHHIPDKLIKEELDRRSGTNDALLRELLAHRLAEDEVVDDFVRCVNELGLRIPGGFVAPSQTLGGLGPFVDYQPLHPAYALAQHHEVPTRLLDWTRDPMVAALMAIRGLIKFNEAGWNIISTNSSDENELAVWALSAERHRRFLKDQHKDLHDKYDRPDDFFDPDDYGGLPFEIYEVPASEIGYLHAQKGVFTYVVGASDKFIESEGRWPTMESIVAPPALKRITLPYSEVHELGRLLSAEHVTFHRLMPSYDRVREYLMTAFSHEYQ